MKALAYLKNTLDAPVAELMGLMKSFTPDEKREFLNDARRDAAASGVELEDADIDMGEVAA